MHPHISLMRIHPATIQLNEKHTIRIEQAENSGYATFNLKITPLNNKL